MGLFIEPFFYNWLILAAVLLIVEVATFTLLFFWLALAAVFMVGVSFFFPELGLTPQLVIFSVATVLSVIIWHRVFKKKQETIGDARMNNRAARYIGRSATLVEPVVNGYGKIQIDDSLWRVQCDEDLSVGQGVEITDADGVTLIVKKR